MADDDFVQPVAPSGGSEPSSFSGPAQGGIWPTSTPDRALADEKPAAPERDEASLVTAPQFSGADVSHDVASSEAQVTYEGEDTPEMQKAKPYEFTEVFDFMVGITPDRLINTVAFTAQRAGLEIWTNAAEGVNKGVKNMFKGGEKGKPSDLPAPPKGTGTGKGH